MKHIVLTLAVAALSLAPVPSVHANPEVYQRTLKATSWVIVPRAQGGVSFGTGVVVNQDRKLILTNFHVVQEAPKVLVFFAAFEGDRVVTDPNFYVKNRDKLSLEGDVIFRDARRDIAVIQMQTLPPGVEALPLAAESPRPAETVHAIGNSGVEGNSDGTLGGTLWRYSKGEVRQVYRRKLKSSGAKGEPARELEARFVETQVPSNPGDSGGPVVNDKGELVAITQSGDLQKQRLVTYGVDVSELQLALSSARSPGEVIAILGGAWSSSRPGTGGVPEQLRMEFRPDGRFVFVTSNPAGEIVKTTVGKYSFGEGRLTLSITGQGDKRGIVSFVSNDEFVLQGTGRSTKWSRLRQ